MSFPVGPLPTVPFLQDLIATGAASKTVAFAHGGSDLDLTDPANGIPPCAFGFWSNGAGNLVVRFAGDSTDRTLVVIASQLVFGAFVVIRATSTVDGVALGRH